eukprot:12886619-Prorocentrum_lima.AAC.1
MDAKRLCHNGAEDNSLDIVDSYSTIDPLASTCPRLRGSARKITSALCGLLLALILNDASWWPIS